ncbi:Mu transposase domain-containing protein [Nakamurella sp. GG22]
MVAVPRPVTAQALVSFRGNRYSVPPELARTVVTVQHRLGSPVLSIAVNCQIRWHLLTTLTGIKFEQACAGKHLAMRISAGHRVDQAAAGCHLLWKRGATYRGRRHARVAGSGHGRWPAIARTRWIRFGPGKRPAT